MMTPEGYLPWLAVPTNPQIARMLDVGNDVVRQVLVLDTTTSPRVLMANGLLIQSGHHKARGVSFYGRG